MIKALDLENIPIDIMNLLSENLDSIGNLGSTLADEFLI